MKKPITQGFDGGAADDELALQEACKHAVAGLIRAAQVDGLDEVDRAFLMRTQRRFARIGGLAPRSRTEDRLSKARPGRPTRPYQRSIVTSLRLTPAQHEALRDLAAREHRSVAQQLRHIIEERVAKAGR
jgi:hypothetical protein